MKGSPAGQVCKLAAMPASSSWAFRAAARRKLPLPVLLYGLQHGCDSRSSSAAAAAAAAVRGRGRLVMVCSSHAGKTVWIQTSEKGVLTAAVESGFDTLLWPSAGEESRAAALAWSCLARFTSVFVDEQRGRLVAEGGALVGRYATLAGGDDLRAAQAAAGEEGSMGGVSTAHSPPAAGPAQGVLSGGSGAEASSFPGEAADESGGAAEMAAAGLLEGMPLAEGQAEGQAEAPAPSGPVVVVDALDWRVIPAENLVAAHQAAAVAAGGGGGARLLVLAGCAADARVLLEALETGTDGVVLRTDDPAEVHALSSYLKSLAKQAAERAELQSARVTRVEPVGMGDRVCVDCAGLLSPGEAMLVGSFARCLFLVHSECGESQYINSRPFRVNAGPVHSYCAAPGGRTAYLSELHSGSWVLAVHAGTRRVRSLLVGRVKVEARPLMLVEAVTEADGEVHSLLVQNAETVKLVGPPQAASATLSAAAGAASPSAAVGAGSNGASGSSGGAHCGDGPEGYVAVPVTSLVPGDKLYVVRQAAARHTGISIQERIVER